MNPQQDPLKKGDTPASERAAGSQAQPESGQANANQARNGSAQDREANQAKAAAVSSLADFQPQEALFDNLPRAQAVVLLRKVFSGVDPELFANIVADLALEQPQGVASILRRSPTRSDIALSSFTEARVIREREVECSGYRFAWADTPNFLRTLVTFDPIGDAFAVRFVWDEELCEFYSFDDQRWEVIEHALCVLSQSVSLDMLHELRTGVESGKKYELGDNLAVVRLGDRIECPSDLLADLHLVTRRELLPFVIPGKFYDLETRAMHIHARLFGCYSLDNFVLSADSAEQREAALMEIWSVLKTDDPRIQIGYVESDDFLLPVSLSTKPEMLEADFAWLKRVYDADKARSTITAAQVPLGLWIQDPSAAQLQSALLSAGCLRSESMNKDGTAASTGQMILQFLLQGGQLDHSQLLSALGAACPNKIESGETIVSDGGEPAQRYRYVEFAPGLENDRPLIRVFSSPIDDHATQSSDAEVADKGDNSDWEASDQARWGKPEVSDDFLTGREALEILEPAAITLRIEWPHVRATQPSDEALAKRWELLNAVLQSAGESVIPDSLNHMTGDHEDHSVYKSSERTSIQISRHPRLISGLNS